MSATGEGSARIGVLALQGGFAAHCERLRSVGAEPVEVRVPESLEGLDGLILPGGESTTISMGIESYGLRRPILELEAAGVPILGTCAGMILCDRDHLGMLDIEARRNAFGRQLASFEANLEMAGIDGGPVRAVFIRAPWVEDHGDGVEVLAECEGHPVAVRSGTVTAIAFHPELTGDLRIHGAFAERCRARPG